MKYHDTTSRSIHRGVNDRKTRNLLPLPLHEKAAQLMDRLEAARELRDLSAPGLRLQKLADTRSGQHVIRVNDQYRICFSWMRGEALDVEITDYH